MTSPLQRRSFLTGLGSFGLLTGLTDLQFLNNLPAISAQDVQVNPRHVRLNADIEPLVRMIEETPRNRLMEETARRVRGGTGYQRLLAALMLAGVKGIRPRPVGYQFHAVLVVNSAHLASLAAHDRDRWLPLFWGLDNFKQSQATNRQRGGWIMPALAENSLPPAHQARQRFIRAMDNWDVEGADTAVAAFVRNATANDVYELFWRYGCRDFRDIGHKAIFVANSWRTLQTIGWRHAEPVVRSLAFALLAHEDDNPANRNDERDQAYRDNVQRAGRIRAEWRFGRIDNEAVTGLLATLRTANAADSCNRVVELLNNRIHPSSVWDALFLRAGELLMQQPAIVGIHCVTSVNALYFGFQTTGDDTTRKLLMLQAAAFLPMFREAMRNRNPRLQEDRRIDTLEPLAVSARGPEAMQEILGDISRDRMTAARKTLALLSEDTADRAVSLMSGARQLIFRKGSNSHDYKFSSAALEDFYNTTPHWRSRFLATSMFNLRGSGHDDNGLVERIREALS